MKKLIFGLLFITLLSSCSNRIGEFDVSGDVTIYDDDWDIKEEVSLTESYFLVKNNAYEFERDGDELKLKITIKRGDSYLPYANIDCEESSVSVRLWGNLQGGQQKVVNFDLLNASEIKDVYRLYEEDYMEIVLGADAEDLEEFNKASDEPFEESVDKEYAELWLFFENKL